MFRQTFFDDLMQTSDAAGVLGHGFTYAGHPVGAAVALEAIKIYDDIDLLAHVQRVARSFLAGCEALMAHPLVGDVQVLPVEGVVRFDNFSVTNISSGFVLALGLLY